MQKSWVGAIAALSRFATLEGALSHHEVTPRLILGDCLERMKEIPDASVDMILADLPYGTTQNKWDSVIPLDQLWREYARLCRGAIVLTVSQPFTSALVMSRHEWFRHAWVWEKISATGHLNAKRMPMKLACSRKTAPSDMRV